MDVISIIRWSGIKEMSSQTGDRILGTTERKAFPSIAISGPDPYFPFLLSSFPLPR